MILTAMRSDEVGEVGDGVLAVLPIGAVEQHAAHLPVGTDAMVVDTLAHRLEADDPERVLLLPTLWFGASDHHLGFPGTATIGSELVSALIVGVVESLHRSSGLTRFLVLNGHGGNEPGMRMALEVIQRRTPGVLAWAASYWSPMFEHLAASGGSVASMDHAGRIETSLLLALAPELVARPFGSGNVSPAMLSSWLFEGRGFDVLTEAGGVGDPAGSTAAAGEELMLAAGQGLAGLVGRLLDQRHR